jgi:LacI family transcriptional regulator
MHGPRATVRDVAALAGTSVATVSRVLNGKDVARFSNETAERVLAAAHRLDYRPSELGRQLRTSKANAAALLVPDASNSFCADVAWTLESALHEAGLSMLLCNTGEEPDRQDEYLAQMVSRGISAIVLLGAVESPLLQKISADDATLIFVNRRPPAPITGHFVGIDNHAAGRDVAEHFIARGYRDCAVIHGPQRYAASAERLEGFSARMWEAGLSVPPSRRVESALRADAGYARAKELFAVSPPRAVFCGNDAIAYGVNAAAQEAGLLVPEDVAIFGFDGSRLNRWVAPWLSTVHVPVQDFGPAITALLSSTPDVPKSTLLPYRLDLRRSA